MATILGAHKNLHVIPFETSIFRNTDNPDLSVIDPSKYGQDILGVVEKTPAHIHHMDLIKSLVPNSKFIVMVREPYDMIASQKHRDGDLIQAHNHIIKDLQKSIEASTKTDVLIVRYEDLIADLNVACVRVCEYLELPFDSQMLRFYEITHNWWGLTSPQPMDGVGWMSHRHRRAWQVRQPIFDGRGRRVELTQEEMDSFLPVTTEYSKRFGYLS
jgi:hypothetical protein